MVNEHHFREIFNKLKQFGLEAGNEDGYPNILIDTMSKGVFKTSKGDIYPRIKCWGNDKSKAWDLINVPYKDVYYTSVISGFPKADETVQPLSQKYIDDLAKKGITHRKSDYKKKPTLQLSRRYDDENNLLPNSNIKKLKDTLEIAEHEDAEKIGVDGEFYADDNIGFIDFIEYICNMVQNHMDKCNTICSDPMKKGTDEYKESFPQIRGINPKTRFAYYSSFKTTKEDGSEEVINLRNPKCTLHYAYENKKDKDKAESKKDEERPLSTNFKIRRFNMEESKFESSLPITKFKPRYKSDSDKKFIILNEDTIHKLIRSSDLLRVSFDIRMSFVKNEWYLKIVQKNIIITETSSMAEDTFLETGDDIMDEFEEFDDPENE